MKTKLVLSALLGCGLLAVAPATSAQGNGQDVQFYKAQFNLAATSEAPPRAKGKASVVSTSQDGVTAGALTVQAQGLEPGDYDINGISASDASTVNLGTLTVEDTGKKTKASAVIDLAEVDATDLGQLLVEAGGVTYLAGDFGDGKSKGQLNATATVIPGEAAPEATGFAKLKSSVKKGVVKNKFSLLANGVAPNTTYLVEVDGVEAASVTSNKRGKVLVKKLPAEIGSIGTVRLLEEGGPEALRVEF